MKRWLLSHRMTIAFLLLLGLFRSAIADWNPVPTASMRPTIVEGDVVFVNRLAYDVKLPLSEVVLARSGDPQRGDIATFTSPKDGTRLIKCVVGIPGDRVSLRDNRLFINGEEARYVALSSEGVAHVGQQGIVAQLEQESIAGSRRRVQWLPDRSSASNFGPVVVPPDNYLMLGDNRDNSEDSRYIGFVPRSALIARAERILVSADVKDCWQPRFERFGEKLW